MYYIKKMNRRLFVVDGNNNTVYTPPNFIRLSGRHELQELVDALNEKGFYCIDLVREWETRMHK